MKTVRSLGVGGLLFALSTLSLASAPAKPLCSVPMVALLPVADGFVVDQFPFDGNGDEVREDAGVTLFINAPLAETRGVVEFDLSSIGASERIQSALLKLLPFGTALLPGAEEFPVHVSGFPSDGAIQAEDFSAGSFLASFDGLATPAKVPVFVNVTSFLQSQSPLHFVGFNLSTSGENGQLTFGSFEFGFPAALLIELKPDPENNLVANGDFEFPAVTHPGIVVVSPSDELSPWILPESDGSVDLVPDSFWQPASGHQSLDLNGSADVHPDPRGTIYQDIAIGTRGTYLLTFWIAGNPAGEPIKQLEVRFGPVGSDLAVVASPTFDISGQSLMDMGWQMKSSLLSVFGAGSYRLQFAGVSPGDRGPALDNVRLVRFAQRVVNGRVDFRVVHTSIGTGGTFLIDADLTNTGAHPIPGPVKAVVTTLTEGNHLVSATEEDGAAGSKQPINVGDSLEPGETIRVRFVIGLAQRKPFMFLVNVVSQECPDIMIFSLSSLAEEPERRLPRGTGRDGGLPTDLLQRSAP